MDPAGVAYWVEGGLALPANGESWLNFFPCRVRGTLLNHPPEIRQGWQEIRLRVGQPILVLTARGQTWLESYGSGHPANIPLTSEDLQASFQLMTQHSVYALEEELRRGFISLPGGHRLGFSGHAVLEQGQIGICAR